MVERHPEVVLSHRLCAAVEREVEVQIVDEHIGSVWEQLPHGQNPVGVVAMSGGRYPGAHTDPHNSDHQDALTHDVVSLLGR